MFNLQGCLTVKFLKDIFMFLLDTASVDVCQFPVYFEGCLTGGAWLANIFIIPLHCVNV